MKHRIRTAAMILLAASIAAPAFAQSAGADTYKAKCAMCHGPDGTAATPMGKMMKIPSFKDPDLVKATDAALIAATKDGKGKMPCLQRQADRCPDQRSRHLHPHLAEVAERNEGRHRCGAQEGRGSNRLPLPVAARTAGCTGSCNEDLFLIQPDSFYVSAAVGYAAARLARADADCLSCHNDPTLQDANGKSDRGRAGTNSTPAFTACLKCSDCHKDIHDYPHPDHPAQVHCESCHTDEGARSVPPAVSTAKASDHPCTSCHGDAHVIVTKTDPQSPVYPLNIPKTCGSCHGNEAMAKKYHLPNVYALYIDSIHGFALGKEGLLVAANCTSCHGSHKILSHTNPQSSTYRTNIPGTCGSCHVGINEQYQKGVHGKAVAAGNTSAPVCTDCHTAHGIVEPTSADFRMQSTPICGSCHRDKFTTYRDTFHSQLGLLGGYVETARCWDCHRRA